MYASVSVSVHTYCTSGHLIHVCICVYDCACERGGERENEKERETDRNTAYFISGHLLPVPVYLHVCVCSCMCA